jgi:hypothetical protein
MAKDMGVLQRFTGLFLALQTMYRLLSSEKVIV